MVFELNLTRRNVNERKIGKLQDNRSAFSIVVNRITCLNGDHLVCERWIRFEGRFLFLSSSYSRVWERGKYGRVSGPWKGGRTCISTSHLRLLSTWGDRPTGKHTRDKHKEAILIQRIFPLSSWRVGARKDLLILGSSFTCFFEKRNRLLLREREREILFIKMFLTLCFFNLFQF